MQPHQAGVSAKKLSRLTLWPLIASTFFMVSGGTFGTEEIVHGAGYGRALIILVLTPVIWSLPTALMLGELSSALPQEGGYYAWVRRALGNFWGFQEAWLSLVASIFDMAIYPTLFVAYLARLLPEFRAESPALAVGLAMIAVCVVLNILGIRVVGATSLWLMVLLSLPFVVIMVVAPFRPGLGATPAVPSASTVGILGGLVIAMWNYMGWDSASTIAAEVEQPQRLYPRALMGAVLVTALTYFLPVAAMWRTGIAASEWETGSWADMGARVGGPWLGVAVAVGAMMSAFGMFNALVMSYSRLPLAMAQDGMLPKVFGRLHPRTRAPWVSILVLAAAWAGCMGLGFERLITIDILIYGAALALEFVALVVLRFTEPGLKRPFSVPGGKAGAVLVGVGPLFLLGFSVVHSQGEQIWGMNGLLFGLLLIAGGVAAYGVRMLVQRLGWLSQPVRNEEAE
jgi:amino acid transporter